MNFTMTAPCKGCPFRSDIPGFLRRGRAEQIANGILGGATFACHETTVSDEDEEGFSVRRETEETQHCAGAMILLEKLEMPNQMMRICERIGSYDHTRLKMDSPVFDTAEDFVEHHNL